MPIDQARRPGLYSMSFNRASSMVRPVEGIRSEVVCCVGPAEASPAAVNARAPHSRPQREREIATVESLPF